MLLSAQGPEEEEGPQEGLNPISWTPRPLMNFFAKHVSRPFPFAITNLEAFLKWSIIAIYSKQLFLQIAEFLGGGIQCLVGGIVRRALTYGFAISKYVSNVM